ncbi:hypothetical protein [Corynebacterium glyciniphilum]|uniref:hypothetical protein n=1 Tax=Corynebacterium glyciniphilum TaxID=1404244 RepID=UPI0011AB3301|nr:hypothetical protein [Corynebacterium glyciniphilum]
MSEASDLREYLTALAAGITAVTDPARRTPQATDVTKVLATAGLVRWSGAPNDSGWKPTAEGRTILTNFRRQQ